jgi:hypothetical protein
MAAAGGNTVIQIDYGNGIKVNQNIYNQAQRSRI